MIKKFKDINWNKDYPKINKVMLGLVFEMCRNRVGIVAVKDVFKMILKKDK